MAPTAIIEWSMAEKGYNEETHNLLVDRAKDGVGLIIPGAIRILNSTDNDCLWNHPEAFEGVSETLDEIHSYGSKVFFSFLLD